MMMRLRMRMSIRRTRIMMKARGNNDNNEDSDDSDDKDVE